MPRCYASGYAGEGVFSQLLDGSINDNDHGPDAGPSGQLWATS